MIEFVIIFFGIVVFVVWLALAMPFLLIWGDKFKDIYGDYCDWVRRRFGE